MQTETFVFSPRRPISTLPEDTEADTEAAGTAAFRETLANPARVVRQVARGEALEGFQVIARAGEALTAEPMPGDILLRTVEGGSAHTSVIGSRGMFESGEAIGNGLRPESSGLSAYAHVVETTPWLHPEAERYSRRMTDSTGRLLDDLLLLRLVAPPTPTPAVISVASTSAVSADNPAPLPTFTTAGAVADIPSTEDEVSCSHIDAAQLSWPGASANALALMRSVYLRQTAAACQIRTFVADVADTDLAPIENGITARRDAADACRRLLTDARSALASDTSAKSVGSLGVISGYRSATHQLNNWNRNFPRYYEETKTDRQALEGGEFGAAAAALLTTYISRRLAAPGFSLHNDGRAVDLTTVDNGRTLGADSNAASRSGWRHSWFFQWLTSNANGYGFFQNTSIDEPWHWEYRGVQASSTQSVEGTFIFASPDTVEPSDLGPRYAIAQLAVGSEATVTAGRLELSNTPLLSAHRGTQPDLILRWNDMTDPSTVDTVIHLHGYSADRANMRLRNKEAFSGLDFVDPAGTGTTGRATPTLGILPRGSYAGKEPGANPERYTFPALFGVTPLTDLINYSLAQFSSTVGTTVSAGRLIVTAHSGGGAGLMGILANNSPMEIQVFDALYNDASPLVTWVNSRIAAEIQAWTPGKTRADGGLCIIFRKGGTEKQSLVVRRALKSAIAGAPADAQPVLTAFYRVLSTSVAHGNIPQRFGWRLLADLSADLTDSTQVPAEALSFRTAEDLASPAENIGDGSPLAAVALDQCWLQSQSLRRNLSAADSPSRLSRVKIAAESHAKVDANPYNGLTRGQLEAVIRAGFSSYQTPEVLLALWAKEGSLRLTTAATPVPRATTPDNARALFRSNVYYVDLGSDYFVLTTYDAASHDNVWINTDDAAPRHEAQFRSQVGSLVGPNLLSEDISSAINAELAVSSAPPFTVTPSIKFYALSLLLMDALFTRMQRNPFPQVSSLSEPLNYLQWNMGTDRFGKFLVSAEQHRQEPTYRLPSGDQPTLEQWALHTIPKSTEYSQARTNAMRFLHYMESYRPIFAGTTNLIKPGTDDLKPPANMG